MSIHGQYCVGRLCIAVAEELPVGWDYWEYLGNRYQSSIIGIVAIVVALLGYRAAMKQLRLATRTTNRDINMNKLERIANLRSLNDLLAAFAAKMREEWRTLSQSLQKDEPTADEVNVVVDRVKEVYETSIQSLQAEGFALIERNFVSKDLSSALKKVLTSSGFGGHPPEPRYNPEELAHGTPGQYAQSVLFVLEQASRDYGTVKAREVAEILDPAAEDAMSEIDET